MHEKLAKLLQTRYRVNDLERTVKFYRDILGLEENASASIRHAARNWSFLKHPAARKRSKSVFCRAAIRSKSSPTSRISRSRWTASTNLPNTLPGTA